MGNTQTQYTKARVDELRDEVRNLQNQVLDLRAELGREHGRRQEIVQNATIGFRDEVRYLQNQVLNLRNLQNQVQEYEHKVRELWPDHLARCVANAMAEAHAHHPSTLTGRCLL